MSQVRIKSSSYSGFLLKLFGLYILLVLTLILFAAPFVTYPRKTPLAYLAPIHFLMALGSGYSLFDLLQINDSYAAERSSKENRGTFSITIMLCSLILVALQAFIVRGGWFVTNWDLYTLADFGHSADHFVYYSNYPNQLFLAGLFERIVSLGSLIGFKNGYLCVVCIGCLATSMSAMLLAHATRAAFNDAVGYCVFAVFSILTALSPWILVPYSDTYGLFFTSMVIWSYCCIGNQHIKWFSMTLFSIVGYLIKPTVVFVYLAIIITSLKDWLPGIVDSLRNPGAGTRQFRASIYNALSRLTSLSLVIAVAIVFSLILKSFIALPSDSFDEEGAFSWTHYLMLGFNQEYLGVWNQDDLDYSRSFPTKASRQAGNIEEWKRRVRDAGFPGVARLVVLKTLSNMADGSFSWEQEGGFYSTTGGDSEAIKSIYGIDEAVNDTLILSRDAPFSSVAQILWFIVLIGIASLFFTSHVSQDEPKILSVIVLTLFMLCGFLTIFECRARYLYLYSGYFVILSIVGWRRLIPILHNAAKHPLWDSRFNVGRRSETRTDSIPTEAHRT